MTAAGNLPDITINVSNIVIRNRIFFTKKKIQKNYHPFNIFINADPKSAPSLPDTKSAAFINEILLSCRYKISYKEYWLS